MITALEVSMNQKEIKQLQKLLLQWAAFIRSGKHERPNMSDDEAYKYSEPMAAEFVMALHTQVKRWEV
jgi:hypothetical protein